MSHVLRVGVADQIAYFRAYNTDGSANTSLTASTTGLSLSVFRVGLLPTSILTLSNKAADNTAHSDGAIRNVGGNLYTVDIPDAACATQCPSICVRGSYTGGVIEGLEHPIVAYDPSVVAVGANTTTPPTATQNAAATLGALLVDYTSTGSVGAAIGAINTKTSALPSDPADASDIAVAFALVSSALTTLDTKIDVIDNYIDTEVSAIKSVTDKMDGMLILDGSVYQFTSNAVENVSGTPVYVYPLALDAPQRHAYATIEVFTEETGTQFFYARDASGVALDLTGKTLEFRLSDSRSKSRLYTAKTSDGTLTISLGNKVTFTRALNFTRYEMSDLRYSLRDVNAGNETLLTGPMKVTWAP